MTNLKNSLAGMSNSSGKSDNIDTNQILMRINILTEDIKKKADKIEVS
jgi:uncharacterized protein YoxC